MTQSDELQLDPLSEEELLSEEEDDPQSLQELEELEEKPESPE
jgi:hypothetical protein